MATRKSRTRRPVRSPYRQPIWLVVGAVIVAVGAVALVVAALILV